MTRDDYIRSHDIAFTFPACLCEMIPLLATRESAKVVLPENNYIKVVSTLGHTSLSIRTKGCM